MNFKVTSLVFFCMIFLLQNSIFSMNYDRVSNSVILNLQTRLYRLKELLGIIDRRVQDAAELETGILRTQVSVRIEECTPEDASRYNQINSSFQELRKDLDPYKEALKNRNRWCGCFCFWRRQKGQ